MISNECAKEYQRLIADNTSGSRELLIKLIKFLEKHQNEIDLDIINNLQNHFSDFQAIRSSLKKFRIAFENNRLELFFKENPSDDRVVFMKIFTNLLPYIKNFQTFITISNSKTILEVLKLISKSNKRLKVIVSEGRPNNEGTILAERLAVNNISTTLITEAQIYQFVQKADCAIIGADKILANGNVVNKVGSNLLAIACKEFNKFFYVISDKSKFCNDNSFIAKELSGSEIFETEKKIEIHNFYFEEINKELITKIITD